MAEREEPLCKGIKRLPSRIKTCIVCGKSIKIPHYRMKTFKYCSRKCKWVLQKDRKVTKSCTVCGKKFSVIFFREKTAKYCSRSCYYEAMKGRGSVELKCAVCGTIFFRSPSKHAKYSVCSRKCRGAIARTEEPGINTYRTWIKRRGGLGRCEVCGFSKIPNILIVHHKDYDRENNNKKNLAVLCPNCHATKHFYRK